jgi:3-phenylpropionate/trans-cinnamate dioxygenase ferredoxin reductase subunit
MTSGLAVIVGASHAGVQVAASLRQEGWTGKILLIGGEATLPYQRPPLSKAYLSKTCDIGEFAIRSAGFYEKQRIERVDATVESIDTSACQVTLNTGGTLTYDKLALCTGASPRRLSIPGVNLAGVHYLRTASDVAGLRAATSHGRRVVIVGGGYIGLETAASLRVLGLEVTVLEAADRVLERVTAPEVSAFFDRIHRAEGVQIRTSTSVEAIVGDDQVREVVAAGGEAIPTDIVIVGIGVLPNTDLAEAAGLDIDDGVVIDDHAMTSNANIAAAGDCASHFLARYGRRVRLESVSSASEQAKVAAASMCGKPKRVTALPWFWSDQYDLKLQIAGLNTGHDEVVLNGDPARDRNFSCFYLQDGELIAADCIGRPRDFMSSKRIITHQLPIDRAELQLAGV